MEDVGSRTWQEIERIGIACGYRIDGLGYGIHTRDTSCLPDVFAVDR